MASTHPGHSPSLLTGGSKSTGRPNAQLESRDTTPYHRQVSETKKVRSGQSSSRAIGPSKDDSEVLRERRPKGRSGVDVKPDESPTRDFATTDRVNNRGSDSPWSLQSLTKTLIGTEATSSVTRRKPGGAAHGKSGSSLVSKTWGPEPDLGSSTLGDQIRSSSRSRRREALLENGVSDPKRRSSPPPTPMHARSLEGSDREDTLAYVHVVRPTDTLAGIVLIYNIEAGALRRANRLWPNDSIQTRSKLLLPVDECLVKGIPTTSAVGSVPTSGASPSLMTGSGNGIKEIDDAGLSSKVPDDKQKGSLLQSGLPSASNLEASSELGPKNHWQHHSNVIIEPVGVVEIARLPRPQLSFFPPHQHRSVLADTQPTLEAEYDPGFGHAISEIARDSLEGLEQVGSAIESFLRKVTVKAGNWVAKESGDLIELTQRLAVSSDQDTGAHQQDRVSEPRFVRDSIRTSATASAASPRATKRRSSKPRSREEETSLI